MTDEEALVKETFLHAANIAEAVTQEDVNAVRNGCVAHGRSLADAAQVNMRDVIVAKLRAVALRIK